MRYFPIFLELTAPSTVLVYGGCEEALRKMRLLAKTEARIAVVAASLHPELEQLLKSDAIEWLSLAYEPDQLNGVTCVVVAPNSCIDAAIIAADARSRNIPVNVIDQAELSTFILPAIVDRDPLVIAIGTEGAGPVMAQGIRAHLEALLPPELGHLLERARTLRPRIAKALPPGGPRRSFWNAFFFGTIRNAFLNSGEQAFSKQVANELAAGNAPQSGTISLITAPDDAELLTLKAHRLLQEADVIVHDRDSSSSILEYARRDAERTAIENNPWTTSQASTTGRIHEMLAHAASGLSVVRLIAANQCALEAELHELQSAAPARCHIQVIPGVNGDTTPWAPLFGRDYNRNTISHLRIAS